MSGLRTLPAAASYLLPEGKIFGLPFQPSGSVLYVGKYGGTIRPSHEAPREHGCCFRRQLKQKSGTCGGMVASRYLFPN